MKLPKISINIPVSSSDDPNVVLKSLEKIDYPENLLEIIIIKGNHLTKQRNKGITKSTGSIIYMLDNDSQAFSKSLKVIVKEFTNKKVAAVGGPSLSPRKSDYFSKVVGYILETYFGAFRMRYKWSQQEKNYKPDDYHFIGCNLALRKKAVVEVGGFNESFKANDETELLRRLKYKGYKLIYTKKLFVYKQHRTNLLALIKQFHHYGQGRANQLLYNPKFEDIFLIAPIAFLLYTLSLLLLHSTYYLLPLYSYTLLAIATSTKASIKYKRLDLLISMTLLYPVIHYSYAMGLIYEMLNKLLPLRRDRFRKKHYKIRIYNVALHKA